MKTLKEIMGGYLENDTGLSPRALNEISAWLPGGSADCPVVPSEGVWETVTDPTRFQKTFQFSDQRELILFVNEVMAYQNHVQHHGKITIDYDSVMIEVYTHDVNTVTELDQEYVHEVDNILIDAQYSSGLGRNNDER